MGPGLYVEIYDPGRAGLEKALKRLKRRVEAAGIFADLRDRRAFMSPGEKRRLRWKRAKGRRARASRERR